MTNSNSIPCPACGFLVFRGGYGSYDCCPVCDWEDDGTQISNPTSEGGANKRSLADAQEAILRRFPLEVQNFEGHLRSKTWRPLRPDEISTANLAKATSHWHSQAILAVSEAYWSKGGV
jgi:uncharacterized Zn finger protein (UPF0148 family)